MLGGYNRMNISLTKSETKNAETIYEMQIKSFMPLLKKYKDYETSPANEPLEKIVERINQPFTDYYIIKCDNIDVGGVRIVKKNNKHYRVSPIFILPEYQGKGIAQNVFQMIVSNCPTGIELTARITDNYLQLKSKYHQRRHHKLEEWHYYCDWIESLPMAEELIVGRD